MSKWRNNIKHLALFFYFSNILLLEDLSMTVCTWVYCLLLNGSLIFIVFMYSDWFNSGFLIVGTTGILGWIIFCCGGCAVHYRMPSSITDLSPWNASSCPQCTCDNQKCFPKLPNVFWETKLSLEGNHWFSQSSIKGNLDGF